MSKSEALIKDLQNAFKRLKEALELPSDDIINQDATIQRFEFTFELAWKSMQAILQENRIETSRGVKTIIRDSADLGLITDPDSWFRFLKHRNVTAHTYKEEETREVYKDLKDFIPLVDELLEKAKDQI